MVIDVRHWTRRVVVCSLAALVSFGSVNKAAACVAITVFDPPEESSYGKRRSS